MRRTPELDALRGIAAVMILALHLGLGRRHAALASAVDLFFVLSGYLITRIILDHGGRPGFLRSFHVRRCLRIGPIYHAALPTLVLVNPILPYQQRLSGWTPCLNSCLSWEFFEKPILRLEDRFAYPNTKQVGMSLPPPHLRSTIGGTATGRHFPELGG